MISLCQVEILTAPLQYNLILPSGVLTITDILLRVLKEKKTKKKRRDMSGSDKDCS